MVTAEDAEPDLEALDGDLEGDAWDGSATERFPLETEIPAEASAAKSSFFATPLKARPTFSFLHLWQGSHS
jgi:hypothetical protein